MPTNTLRFDQNIPMTDEDDNSTSGTRSPPNGGNGHAGLSRRLRTPVFLKWIWHRLGLDLELVQMMAKGALPPAIGAAIFESTPVANTFTTLGYLVSLMAFFSFCTQPRARFIQTMLLNSLGVCLLAGVSMLAVYCAVRARTNTRTDDEAIETSNILDIPYNSSASAVIAIWLCFMIYCVNLFRAAKPHFGVTGIIFSFFVLVACTNATRVSNLTQGKALIKRLLGAFLTGFAIAVGTSFLVFPRSSRIHCFALTEVFIGRLKECLRAQGLYMRRMRRKNILFTCVQETNMTIPKREAEEVRATSSPEAANLKAATAELTSIFGKMHTELEFATQEFAYGRLDAYDIKQLYSMLQSILLPMNGMSTLVDVLKEVAIRAVGVDDDPVERPTPNFSDMKAEQDAWREVMNTLLDSFDGLSGSLEDALDYIYNALRFRHPRRHSLDAERGRAAAGVGSEFAAHLIEKIEAFDQSRMRTLRTWSKATGVQLPIAFLTNPSEEGTTVSGGELNGSTKQRKNQQRLYLILYIEFLTGSIGKGILDLVIFADAKTEEACRRGKRLILPGRKRVKKVFRTIMQSGDITPDPTEGYSSGRPIIHLGQAYHARKDPEHLPPEGYWERLGDHIRRVAHFFASEESAFGMRAVCAVMTIAIVAFLEDTQAWFLQQRGLWALVLVSISMQPTTGASFTGFLGRVLGTICAMCTSIIVWYIPNGHAAGVIPLLWLSVFVGYYFLLKFPQWAPGALIFNVTQLLIVSYELGAIKLGRQVISSNGQVFLPIYLLAPYRLAAVTTGTFVAFIWSYFPFPNTSHGALRRELGSGLYLLANYYSTIHTTVELRLSDDELDIPTEGGPARKLEKARNRVYAKIGIQLSKLRDLSGQWDPTVGGKFPRTTYEDIIRSMQNIFNYVTLISYSTRLFSPSIEGSRAGKQGTTGADDVPSEFWIQSFRAFMRSLNITTHEVTSMLSLLSASVTNGQPLPPYLKIPTPYNLFENLEISNPAILRIEHVTEPCYSAFAVCQVASSLVSEELERLIELVKTLVGEVDFSFHVISTRNLERSGTAWSGKGKHE